MFLRKRQFACVLVVLPESTTRLIFQATDHFLLPPVYTEHFSCIHSWALLGLAGLKTVRPSSVDEGGYSFHRLLGGLSFRPSVVTAISPETPHMPHTHITHIYVA
jgi:hypothetical protein